jgi:iron complex outermembrane receptor protein
MSAQKRVPCPPARHPLRRPDDGGQRPEPYAPQWTSNFGIQYELRLGGGTSLTPRLNYAYLGGQFTSLTYSRVTDYLPAHSLLSAVLTVKLPERWTAEAYGNS